ncbi:CD1375 family protein [Coprococcus comes]|nr:CD1375 family protein [Coprococcus comes]
MVKIYAALILKGVKTIDDVPDKLKEAVKAILDGEN